MWVILFHHWVDCYLTMAQVGLCHKPCANSLATCINANGRTVKKKKLLRLEQYRLVPFINGS